MRRSLLIDLKILMLSYSLAVHVVLDEFASRFETCVIYNMVVGLLVYVGGTLGVFAVDLLRFGLGSPKQDRNLALVLF